MMTQERPLLALGQQVALAVHRSNATDWHTSRVVEIDESLVWVATPDTEIKPTWPVEGDELFVRVVPSGDSAYKMHARVVVVKMDVERLVGLRIIGSSPGQPREYFRVPVSITTDEATLTSIGGSRFPATMHLRDLSATGMRAHCDAPVFIGDQIRMRLTLTGQRLPRPSFVPTSGPGRQEPTGKSGPPSPTWRPPYASGSSTSR